jgi:hypothetical protein
MNRLCHNARPNVPFGTGGSSRTCPETSSGSLDSEIPALPARPRQNGFVGLATESSGRAKSFWRVSRTGRRTALPGGQAGEVLKPKVLNLVQDLFSMTESEDLNLQYPVRHRGGTLRSNPQDKEWGWADT